MTTQIDSVNTPITMSLSGLAASATFITGINSDQIQNTQGYIDALVTVLPITSGVTAPTVGQYISVWAVGQNVSFVTNPIAGIDGTSGACLLAQVSTLNSLRFVGSAVVTVATADLLYYIQPFSIAQLFGGIVPKFWCLYAAHNMTPALGANAALFSFNGITY